MNKENLEYNSRKIEKKINDVYIDFKNKKDPVTDGIINIDNYIGVKYKILWILKEPTEEIDEDGGWNLIDYIFQKTNISEFGKSKKTFLPIMMVNYGILNNFENYLCANNGMLDYLKCYAHINIKKIPGLSKSNENELLTYYNKYKNIIIEQIDSYNPQIIIFGLGGGKVFNSISKDLDLNFDSSKGDSAWYLIKNDKIYINAYHPSQRKASTNLSKEQYCNDIINCVKEWEMIKNK